MFLLPLKCLLGPLEPFGSFRLTALPDELEDDLLRLRKVLISAAGAPDINDFLEMFLESSWWPLD